jgi:16S rRNA (cytosine967-C5)-methyltransferase
MRLHRNLAEAVVNNLGSILEDGRYADRVLEWSFQHNPKWGARDRRFVAETTYDIVRWFRLFAEISGAREGDYWALLAAWCFRKGVPLPAWDEFRGVAAENMGERLEAAADRRAIRESIPDWLDAQGERELGPAWDRELGALNEQARVVLRANTLKVSRERLEAILRGDEGIETDSPPGYPDALVLRERQNLFSLASFREGLFEVQDAGSQRIAPFLEAAPGMRVVDACAGAGGKSLHLAALMQNRGRILALDTDEKKLVELKKRARRAGANDIIESRHIDSSKVIKRLADSADRVLLDVPCSGLGTLRRNPDAKWKLSPESLDKVRALQREILAGYSAMLKPGGLLVYATCSILPSENQAQVAHFLETRGDAFELVGEQELPPSAGFDGFYMGKIRRRMAAPRSGSATAKVS